MVYCSCSTKKSDEIRKNTQRVCQQIKFFKLELRKKKKTLLCRKTLVSSNSLEKKEGKLTFSY